jgi:hypothetical protein
LQHLPHIAAITAVFSIDTAAVGVIWYKLKAITTPATLTTFATYKLVSQLQQQHQQHHLYRRRHRRQKDFCMGQSLTAKSYSESEEIADSSAYPAGHSLKSAVKTILEFVVFAEFAVF